MYMIGHVFEFFVLVNGYLFTIGIAALQVLYFARRIRDSFKKD